MFKHTGFSTKEYGSGEFNLLANSIVSMIKLSDINPTEMSEFKDIDQYFQGDLQERVSTVNLKSEGARWEADVERFLEKGGYTFTTQRQVLIYLCDFMIGEKNILELNGKHHYSRRNRQRLFPDLTKNYILTKEGYNLVD